MKPNIEGAAFRPDKKMLEFVQKCAIEIEPNDSKLANWSRSYAENHSNRIAMDVQLFERYASKTDLVLEYGSIPLLFTAAVAKLGYKISGVDLDPRRFSTTIKKLSLDIFTCDIEHNDIPLEDNSFDVIVFNELFEHLRINPIFTFSEVSRVLKPNGTILLSTPNMRSLKGYYNFLIKNRTCSASLFNEYSKLERLGHMGHVREYTTREVMEFLQSLGFEVHTLVFRGSYNSKVARLFCRLMPTLRPLVTYIASARTPQ